MTFATEEPILEINAPWMPLVPRPRLDGSDSRRPDPEAAGLKAVVINSFDITLDKPYRHAAISMAIPVTGNPYTVASMKLLVDAVVSAGFINDDRNDVIAVRLHRYVPEENSKPTVNVSVLESRDKKFPFVRYLTPVQQTEPRASVVSEAAAYAYTTGVPGAAVFSHASIHTPEDYIKDLRSEWNTVLENNSIKAATEWTDLPPTGCSLSLRIPASGDYDPDNVALRLLDMLETARRDTDVTNTNLLTIDQMLNDVAIIRDCESGIYAALRPCAPFDEASTLRYFRRTDDIEAKWPDR